MSWYRESKRHAMAARGLKSAQKVPYNSISIRQMDLDNQKFAKQIKFDQKNNFIRKIMRMYADRYDMKFVESKQFSKNDFNKEFNLYKKFGNDYVKLRVVQDLNNVLMYVEDNTGKEYGKRNFINEKITVNDLKIPMQRIENSLTDALGKAMGIWKR